MGHHTIWSLVFVSIIIKHYVRCDQYFDLSYEDISSQEDFADIYTKDIFSIEKPVWIFKSGMSKGIRHDRQDLGVVLLENTVLKIRQVNPEFTDALKVRLLGNDRRTDRLFDVYNCWVELKGRVPLVPFIDTPYGTINPKIEYSIIGDARPLPIYEHGSNETTFFLSWNKNDSNYALIKNQFFQLLLSPADKNFMKELTKFAYESLDSFIEHYQDVFNYYNDLAGFDCLLPTDCNSKSRFFFRADAGASYNRYRSLWAATSNNSTDFWFKSLWEHLSVIGSGYQPRLAGMGANELTNHLFRALYEVKARRKNIWSQILFNGNKVIQENSFNSDMKEYNGMYEDLPNPHNQLILLMSLTETAGNGSLTKVYKAHRASANCGQSEHENSLQELINRHYSDNSELDFAPVLQRLGLAPTQREAFRNRLRGFRPIAALMHVVPSHAISKARMLLDPYRVTKTDYQLVTNSDLAPLKLQGDVVIKLQKSHAYQSFRNVTVQIKDGNKIVAEKSVRNGDIAINFHDVPNGVYSVVFTGTSMISKRQTSHYAYVRDKINIVNISLENIEKSSLISQSIEFYGHNNKKFATFVTDLNANSAYIMTNKIEPIETQSVINPSRITVKDSEEKLKYEIFIKESDIEITFEQIALNENDTIEIFHPRNKLHCTDDIIIKESDTNKWRVTEHGLKNLNMNQDPIQILIAKIYKLANTISEDSEFKNVPLDMYDEKKNLIAAIGSLDVQNQVIFLQNYESLLPAFALTLDEETTRILEGALLIIRNNKSELLTKTVVADSFIVFENVPHGSYSIEFSTEKADGTITKDAMLYKEGKITPNTFSDQHIDIYGLNGYFAELNILLSENSIIFKKSSALPHVYYTHVFTSIEIRDANTKMKFATYIEGNNTLYEYVNITLMENYTVTIYHPEPWRLKSDDVAFKRNSPINTWRVTKFGLQNLGFNDDPQTRLMYKIDSVAKKNVNESNGLSNDIQTKLSFGIFSLEEQYRLFYLKKYSCLFPQYRDSVQNKFKEMKGQLVEIRSGERIIGKAKVEGNTLTFYDIPNGFYTIHLSETSTEHNNVQQEINKEPSSLTDNAIEISNKTRLVDEIFLFNGLGNGEFARLETFIHDGYGTFMVIDTNPHVYFNEVYAAVKVRDVAGTLKYEKSLHGRSGDYQYDNFSLQENDTIEILHLELNFRLHCDNDIINNRNTTNKWLVTKYGLKNLDLSYDPQTALIVKIETKASSLLEHIKPLQRALKSLEEPYRTVFEKRYAVIFIMTAFYNETLDNTEPYEADIHVCDKNVMIKQLSNLQDLEVIKKLEIDANKAKEDLQNVQSAIMWLEEPHRSTLRNKYSTLFPIDNTVAG